jgi:sugar lactone lactonase YvrE
LADCQLFSDKDQKSRLLRIAIKDGKPTEVVTVVDGFNVSNGVIIRDGYIYVTETILEHDSDPLISGVFRFKVGDEGIKLKTPVSSDPHLIATIESYNTEIGFGADGLTFDSKGNLYIGNFADGTVHQIQFDDKGIVKSNKIFAKTSFMKSADGIFCDKRTDKIYVSDSLANAVQIVSPDGSVQTLAQDGNNTGAAGRLDQPCEVLIRGNQLIISNMDFPVPTGVNTTWDKPYTLSVVDLD